MTPSPSRAPGPAPLEQVRRFLNTTDIESGKDEIADPDALRAWLAAEDLGTPGGVDRGDLERALGLREAIRDLLDGAGGGADAARATINAAGERAGLRPVLGEDGGSRLEPSGEGFDAALGRLVASIHRAAADGTLVRLKVCERDSCRWAFYDQSKNRSARWCSMEVCGSREKSMRAYRKRRAAG